METSANRDIDFAMALGEIRGQLRELIHNVSNRAQRDEAVAQTLGELSALPADIREIKESVADIDNRLTKLELAKAGEDGGKNLIKEILKSPVLAWIMAIGSFIYLAIQTRISSNG